MAGRINFPQLFEANPVDLRIAAHRQPIVCDELTAKVAASTFGKQHVFRVQLHPGLKMIAGLAVTTHAEVSGDDTAHRTFAIKKETRGCKAWVDLDPRSLGLLTQPAHHVAEADDIVAVVSEAVRECPFRRLPGFLLG